MNGQWMGVAPKECDLCNLPILNKFVDGATKRGPWACMCPLCHPLQGRGLGVGRGQEYTRKGDKWLKTGG